MSGRLSPRGWYFLPWLIRGLGFRLQVYELVGKSVISVIRRPKGITEAFYDCEKVEKTFCVLCYHI